MRLHKNQSGFSIIELMVVVAIVGILAAVAIPGYVGYRLKAQRSLAWTDLQTLRLLEEQFFSENGNYAGPFVSTAAIQAVGALPAFQPDKTTMALYTYTITLPAGNLTFLATAARVAGTGTDTGSPWTIDNTNTSNFQ